MIIGIQLELTTSSNSRQGIIWFGSVRSHVVWSKKDNRSKANHGEQQPPPTIAVLGDLYLWFGNRVEWNGYRTLRWMDIRYLGRCTEAGRLPR